MSAWQRRHHCAGRLPDPLPAWVAIPFLCAALVVTACAAGVGRATPAPTIALPPVALTPVPLNTTLPPVRMTVPKIELTVPKIELTVPTIQPKIQLTVPKLQVTLLPIQPIPVGTLAAPALETLRAGIPVAPALQTMVAGTQAGPVTGGGPLPTAAATAAAPFAQVIARHEAMGDFAIAQILEVPLIPGHDYQLEVSSPAGQVAFYGEWSALAVGTDGVPGVKMGLLDGVTKSIYDVVQPVNAVARDWTYSVSVQNKGAGGISLAIIDVTTQK